MTSDALPQARRLPVVKAGAADTSLATRLEEDLRRAVRGEVRFDVATRGVYAVDASNYRLVPVGAVIPETLEDVVKTVEVCARHQVPIVSRGGGTSLAGQCCNAAVVIDWSKYLHEIIDVDIEGCRATVQPGVVHDQLEIDVGENGDQLVFGPDPATHAWCTFGGMIGNNACGIHAQLAGRADQNVHEMEILTSDGVRMRVGPTSEEELEAIIAAGGRRGEIYAELKAIRDEYGDVIRQRYPDIPRRVSGYNLPALLPENGFNVAQALVGTEGTCATMLEATVRLVRRPANRALVVIGYRDVFASADHIEEVLEAEPMGLEGVDDCLLEYMQQKGMHPAEIEMLPEGNAWLFVEIGGQTAAQAEKKGHALRERLEAHRGEDLVDIKVVTDPQTARKLWEVRESGLGATARVPGMADTWPGWEDVGVPPARLGDYLREFRALLDAYDYRCSVYGHFGQGCVHCRITFDLESPEGVATYRRFSDEMVELVSKYGGSLSGEHGDGQARGELLPRFFGEEIVEAMRRFKRAFDPAGLMNPGKVIDAYPLDANLRLGPDYDPWEPDTARAFPDDDGKFSRAALRCVGVGKCRRTDDAFMCPSFIATRDEVHTTRGRAHLLHEMMSGGLIHDGWQSEAVKESLDLCLACKGCKIECPVAVDLAAYRSEFLYHHFEGRLKPRQFYAMGHIERWARLAQLAPSLANAAARTPGLGHALKLGAGIAQQRQMPKFAKQTASQWLKRRESQGVGDRGEVCLLVDVFNDHFFPQSLQAAVETLEEAGYAVVLPARRPPAVRPLVHYGMLDEARQHMQDGIDLLGPFAERGVRVVGVEPSSVAIFRDELRSFFPHDETAGWLSENALTLPELLLDDEVELPSLPGKVLLHEHCHQKAALRPGATQAVLEKMGKQVTVPQAGCCGMAGAFGFEAEHYALSEAIAEHRLLPAVRSSERETEVVIEGFSCREQIAQGCGRQPAHIAEVLREALVEPRRARARQERKDAASVLGSRAPASWPAAKAR